jgi:hypothetical protein
MSPDERVARLNLSNELGDAWDGAYDETALRRLEEKHPGFMKRRWKELEPSWEIDHERAKRMLSVEISRAVWEHSPEWKRATAILEDLKIRLGKLIDANPRIKAGVKPFLKKNLERAKLVPPHGSANVSGTLCKNNHQNAFYVPFSHEVTLCEGPLTSFDPTSTLAHELTHAIGAEGLVAAQLENSEFSEKLLSFGHSFCSKTPVDCKAWKQFRKDFDDITGQLYVFQPWHEDLFDCLQKSNLKSAGYFQQLRAAESLAEDSMSWMAQYDYFLKLSQPRTQLIDGSIHPNPVYLNPCATGYWEYIGDMNVEASGPALVAFSGNYACSDEDEPKKRLKDALETTKSMLTQLLVSEIRMEKSFSSRWLLHRWEYTDNVDERLSDVVSSELMGQLLKEVADPRLRLSKFVSNFPHICSKSGVEALYPELAQVQSELHYDPHSFGQQRRNEYLRSSIREALQCRKDFDLKECEF